jgi:hypothetical protein
MDYPTQYFLDTFIPKSNKVTFTIGSYVDEWDPMYLASISSVYRDIPECDTFEVNERHTIVDMNTAYFFHKMLPITSDWHSTNITTPIASFEREADMDDDREGQIVYDEENYLVLSLDDVYRATDLCNFLGIKANSHLEKTSTVAIDVFDPTNSNVLNVIPYHQMFEKLDYEIGMKKCEAIFESMFGLSQSNTSMSRLDKKNATYSCIVQAYVEFAKQTKNLSREQIAFLRDRMGWEDVTERYGVVIECPRKM